MLRPLIYTLMAGLQTYALAWDVLYIPCEEGIWAYKLKFLTVIFMSVYTLYLILCALRSYIDYWATCCDRKHGPHTQHPSLPKYYSYSPLHSLIDSTYSVFVFPVGMFVVVMFWTLYYIDRELVYPLELDEIIPHWLNQMMHTAPVVFILVDSLLVCHHLPSKTNGTIIHTGLIVLYEISLCVWYVKQGFWAYPILDVLDNQHRVLFFLATMIFSLMLFYLGHLLNYIVWGNAAYALPKIDSGSPNQQSLTKSSSKRKIRKD